MAATLPRNGDIADQLDLLADLSEILGEQSFRVLAYRRAASRIRETAASVAELALAGKAKELPGIGKTIEQKVVEVVESGEMHALSRRREQVPGEVATFMRLPGLGPKTAARIWRELDVTTIRSCRKRRSRGACAPSPASGRSPRRRSSRRSGRDRAQSSRSVACWGSAYPSCARSSRRCSAHPAAVDVSEAGSTRRRRETFRDLDVIATATDPAALTSHFVELPWVLEVVARGDTKATVITKQGLRLDLRVVPPESYGNLLQHFTGSKEHNVALREEAQRRGFSVSEYGVTVVETGDVRTFRDEEALYAFLGYELIPPELRENTGELAAAREGRLPALVELGDLRGEMHCHSTWSSDGKATIAEMAEAAAARGYAYLCLTDHSHYLREGRIEAQWEEIAEVNARLKRFRVVRGIEANITAKGEVDVPADVLAELDWVIASLHTSFDRSPTERILAAIDDPNVDCIGHLTGRRLSRRRGCRGRHRAHRRARSRDGYRARDQLPAGPARHARTFTRGWRGRPACSCPSIPTPIPRERSAYAELGIGQARRAWLTKKQVLNTRPWAQIATMLR